MTTDRNDAQGAGLLPCPFCGEQENVIVQRAPSTLMYVYCINCDSCGMESNDRSQAIAGWNRRAPQPDWSYSGGATVMTSGGGLLHMRLDGPLQSRPQDGQHEATVTITFAYSPQPDAEGARQE